MNDEKKEECKNDINTNSPSKKSQTVDWEAGISYIKYFKLKAQLNLMFKNIKDCCEEDEDEEDESDEDEEEESSEEDGESSSADSGDEEESGEETTENSTGDEEEEEDDDENEDGNEDEDEKYDVDEKEAYSQTAKKIVQIEEAIIQRNKSDSVKKTPAAKKPIHLSKRSATASKSLNKKKTTNKSINKTILKANLSQLKSATYDDLNRDQLVALCKSIKKELDNSKIEFTLYELDLRNELVSTWSKRVEETDSYYQ